MAMRQMEKSGNYRVAAIQATAGGVLDAKLVAAEWFMDSDLGYVDGIAKELSLAARVSAVEVTQVDGSKKYKRGYYPRFYSEGREIPDHKFIAALNSKRKK